MSGDCNNRRGVGKYGLIELARQRTADRVRSEVFAEVACLAGVVFDLSGGSVACRGASAYPVEVVLGAVAGDLLADARALCVGCPEVDS
jgi:hypothetical protein